MKRLLRIGFDIFISSFTPIITWFFVGVLISKDLTNVFTLTYPMQCVMGIIISIFGVGANVSGIRDKNKNSANNGILYGSLVSIIIFGLTAIYSCFINTVNAKGSYYIISIRRNETDESYDKASSRVKSSIDQLVNDRMNDIYDIISDNRDSYISDKGEMDEILNELELSTVIEKRSNSDVDDLLYFSLDSEEEEPVVPTKFKFINRNRPMKTTNQALNTSVKYIPLESKIVSHICPIKNYYAIKAYLTELTAKKVRKLPNVISCEKARKLERPKYKITKHSKSNKKEKRASSSKYYDLSYIQKETGWSGVSVQQYAEVHLAVLSQYNYDKDLVSNFDYNYYYPTTAGKGIDIYFIDEGIYVNHEDFDTYKGKNYERTVTCDAVVEDGIMNKTNDKTKKKCSIGGEYQDHGNMVASVAAGSIYGVAKKANIHMIATDFYDFDFTVALDYIKLYGKPHKSVISISRNGVDVFSEAIQSKIDEMVDAGYILLVSSGNDGDDACDSKYVNKFAGYNNVITVGATFNDQYSVEEAYTAAYYSNYGSCVDIHAPGFISGADFYDCDISSSTICTSYSVSEGTSYSAPIVAGVAALIMSENPNTEYTYKTLRKALIDKSLKNIIKELGSSKTPNRFVNNGKHIVYSPDKKYYGCGVLSGNTVCSNGCCTKYGHCLKKEKDENNLCKIENGCQSEFGHCTEAETIVNPVDSYGMTMNTVKKSINTSSNFESFFLSHN